MWRKWRLAYVFQQMYLFFTVLPLLTPRNSRHSTNTCVWIALTYCESYDKIQGCSEFVSFIIRDDVNGIDYNKNCCMNIHWHRLWFIYLRLKKLLLHLCIYVLLTETTLLYRLENAQIPKFVVFWVVYHRFSCH